MRVDSLDVHNVRPPRGNDPERGRVRLDLFSDLLDPNPQQWSEDHRLRQVDHRASQVLRVQVQTLDQRTTQIGIQKFNLAHLRTLQAAFSKYAAGKIRSLEVRLSEITRIELRGSEPGEAKLGISLVAFRDEDILTVGLARAKTGHPAIDEFNSDKSEAAGLQIRQIAADQTDVLAIPLTQKYC